MRSRAWALGTSLAACLAIHGSAAGQGKAAARPAESSALVPSLPPTGEERDRLIAQVRTSYPDMPEELVSLLAETRAQIIEDSRCELLEWITSPRSSAPDPARQSAARALPTCRLPIDELTPAAAEAMLGTAPLAARIDNGVLTVIARAPATKRLCCSLQGALERVAQSDIWAARRRVPEPERAMLMFATTSPTPQVPVFIRGPLAPPAPPRVQGALAGQVFAREIDSTALGERRSLTIYLPPGWTKAQRWPVVYLADGAAGVFAPIVERLIADGEIDPLVLVSAAPAPFGIVGPAPSLPIDLRSAEYIHRYPGGQGADRFARHMTFFAEELPRYAQAEFGVSAERAEVAVAGFSSGGVLALWAGLLHPETFGEAIPMSPGMAFIEPSDLTRTPRARFQVSGGLYEPGFLRTARSVEETLEAAGYDIRTRYPVAGHAQDQWEYVFAEAVREIFRRD